MDWQVLIPITMFICITYAIKLALDARLRFQLVREGAAADALRSLVEGEAAQRRHSSLRWGITLVAIAIAFGIIEASNWREVTPGTLAVLAGAVGVGNLAFFMISRLMNGHA